MSNNETKLLEPINYTIMHTIYQQFSVLTENSALAPSLLATGWTVGVYPDSLQEVDVIVWDNAGCNKAYSRVGG